MGLAKRITSAPRVAILGLAFSCAFLPTANADTDRRQDARGDAPAAIDISIVDYSHGQKRVEVSATIPDLGRRGSASLSISRFNVFEAGYVLQIRKRPGSTPRTRLYYFDHFALKPRECDNVSGKWGTGMITLRVARNCLEGHATNRLFVQFGVQREGSVDRAPAVRRLARG